MTEEFMDLEKKDGIRMTWNVLPGTGQEATNIIIPIAAIYTPLKPSHMTLLPYSPLRCSPCRAVLSLFSVLDYVAEIWTCPFCYSRNRFPSYYPSLSQQNPPTELLPEHTTVEYQFQHHQYSIPTPVYLFVVDTCVIEEEFEFLKSALCQALHLIPDNAIVGLITFGTHVQVHELGFPQMPKTHVFNGNKEVTKDQLLDQLCFFLETPRPTVGVVAGPRDGLSAESIRRFLLPATDCQFLLTSVFEELQMDPWYVPSDERPTRCTGTALNVAACLLGACVPGSGARIMAFVGGPSTKGPAPIISKTLSEPFRTHNDLKKDNVPFYDKAVEFYKNLSKQLLHQCHVLDLFACALDQVGVAEMKSAVQRTGGMIVLSESFGHSIFKDSLRRVFQSTDYDIGLSFNGIFEINCSKDIKVQGIIGPCASLERKGRLCSDSVIGEGNTIAWKMCGLDNQTSLCIFFDIATIRDFNEIVRSESNQFYFQFLTYYQHSDGRMRLRSTTISRRWVSGLSYTQDLLPGFDQEAATIVMTRLVSFKMETEPAFDPIRWIDRSLIRLCSWFGDYQKDRPSSFNISPRFSNFPEYMFYLRRSQFVQVSNNSPDETAYFRIVLNRENVSNSILMIQPTLISYSLDLSPKPVPLDVTSIADDKILLLDSYFTIVIFHSTTIAHWRKAGYHKQTEFEAFAALLQAPHNEADRIIKERWSTVPRLVICDQYSSQARFLLAKLNPSVMHGSDNRPLGGEVIITDDVGFQEFMDHLLQRITNV